MAGTRQSTLWSLIDSIKEGVGLKYFFQIYYLIIKSEDRTVILKEREKNWTKAL